MKKLFTLCFGLAYLGLVSFTIFEKKIGSTACYEEGYSAIPVGNGFLISGNYNCQGGAANYKSFLVMLNENGDTVWSKKDLTVNGIAKQVSGNHLIFIGGNHAGLVYDSIYISKADNTGNLIWTKSFYFPQNKNSVTDIIEVSNGYVVSGFYSVSTNSNPSYDAFLMKIDLNGNTVWTKTFTGALNEQFHSLKEISKDRIAVAGWSNSFSVNGKADYLLAVYDAYGNLITSKQYGDEKDNFCYGLEVLNDGTFVLNGYSDKLELLHVRPDLSLVSTKTYHATCGSNYFKIKKTSDNGLALTGTENINGKCSTVFYKLKMNGDVVWKKHFDGILRSFNETPDGKFVMTGYADYLPDMYVVLFDSVRIQTAVFGNAENELKDVNIDELLKELGIVTKVDEQLLEEKFPSVKIFPNPASQTVNVKFNNPNRKSYRIDVYDVEGQMVYMQTGITSDEFVFYRGNISKGIYTYRLSGEGNSYCGKFIFD